MASRNCPQLLKYCEFHRTNVKIQNGLSTAQSTRQNLYLYYIHRYKIVHLILLYIQHRLRHSLTFLASQVEIRRDVIRITFINILDIHCC